MQTVFSHREHIIMCGSQEVPHLIQGNIFIDDMVTRSSNDNGLKMTVCGCFADPCKVFPC